MPNVVPLDLCNDVDSNLIFTEDGTDIHAGDRLVLINGRRIRSKEKLIERLAHDRSVTLTVMDSQTDELFKHLELEVTEDFIANLSIPDHSNFRATLSNQTRNDEMRSDEVKTDPNMIEDQFRELMESASNALSTKYNKKIDTYKSQLSLVKKEKRQMRSDYEYQTGRLKGMSEAILRQNQEMRKKILDQNKRIQEFQKRESQSKLILRELEESLERVTSHGHHTQPRSPLIDYQTLRVPPALPPRPVQHHPHTNNPLLTDDVITLSDIEESEVI